MSLADLVDLALRNHPDTRAAWIEAKAAQARLGSARAAYLPDLGLQVPLVREEIAAAVGGRFDYRQTTLNPSLALSWLVFDFGGRSGDIGAARHELWSADFAHNAVIQDVVLHVTSVYYQYQDAKAQVEAARVSLRESESSLDATGERMRVGVASLMEVLQARTARAQTQLSLDRLEGLHDSLRGALASAAGLPPTVPLEVGDLPSDLEVRAASESVDRLIEQAAAARPDLAALRATAAAAHSRARSVRAGMLPRLELGSAYTRNEYLGSELSPSNSYYAALTLRVPLLTALKVRQDARAATLEAEAAEARADSYEQTVLLQVWTSYHDLQAAARRVATAGDLLETAGRTHQAARQRYDAGVGGILDLLTAEDALAGARAQEIQSRTDWLLALAQLAHDTGSLRPPAGAASSPR